MSTLITTIITTTTTLQHVCIICKAPLQSKSQLYCKSQSCSRKRNNEKMKRFRQKQKKNKKYNSTTWGSRRDRNNP